MIQIHILNGKECFYKGRSYPDFAKAELTNYYYMNNLTGIDVLSGGTTLLETVCLPSEKGSTRKRNEFAPKESNFFSSIVNLVSHRFPRDCR